MKFWKSKKFKLFVPNFSTLLVIVVLIILLIFLFIKKPINKNKVIQNPNLIKKTSKENFKTFLLKEELTYTTSINLKENTKKIISSLLETEILDIDNNKEKKQLKLSNFISLVEKLNIKNQLNVVNDLLLLNKKSINFDISKETIWNKKTSFNKFKNLIFKDKVLIHQKLISNIKTISNFQKEKNWWKKYIYKKICDKIIENFKDNKGNIIKFDNSFKKNFSELKVFLNKKIISYNNFIKSIQSKTAPNHSLTITFENNVDNKLLNNLKNFFKFILKSNEDIKILNDPKKIKLDNFFFTTGDKFIINKYKDFTSIKEKKQSNLFFYSLQLKQSDFKNKKVWLPKTKYQWFTY